MSIYIIMPNKKGGKKGRRGKKGIGEQTVGNYPKADNNFYLYGKVTKLPGNNHVYVQCSDDKERRGIIRGVMRRRKWMRIGDIVLIRRRGSSEDETCDVEYKYNPAEAKQLKSFGEIKFDVKDDEDDKSRIYFDECPDNSDEEEEEKKLQLAKKEEVLIDRGLARDTKAKITDDTIDIDNI